ncbi:hypothetical protein ARAM_002323 [Aspergillus rambellii]|uniref:SGNH hydrolase-type esterase domain-containing protein n=1 Tax=Aspergillus rambellii TaxID=308745 RepID=A0A0F8W3B3_9EURO|nr:hypothetical protein ARAM_002323 [Aspergillus rambellii]
MRSLLVVLFGLYSSVIVSAFTPPALGERRNDAKTPLRILPLGASITWGQHSASGNGYRKPLRDGLRYGGWEVDMVGSRNNGNMVDNDVEATDGYTIQEVANASLHSLPYKPNVVLIEAGTNDCLLNDDIPKAGERMEELIHALIHATDMQQTAIVLATLLPSGNENIVKNRLSVNDQYRELVKALRKKNGISIVLADMDPPPPNGAHGWISYPTDFTAGGKTDEIHPNDYGYEKMAVIWNKAITEAAASQGFIVKTASILPACPTPPIKGDRLPCLKDHIGDDDRQISNPGLPKMPPA